MKMLGAQNLRGLLGRGEGLHWRCQEATGALARNGGNAAQ
jgi:hypothetical protein